jgi:hypothetical protein
MEVIAVAAGVLLLIGFICGYGFRALISRWHRAKATRRRFERMAEEDAQRGGMSDARLLYKVAIAHGPPTMGRTSGQWIEPFRRLRYKDFVEPKFRLFSGGCENSAWLRHKCVGKLTDSGYRVFHASGT